MSRAIDTKDAAKMIRVALKREWPNVKFSVRCDRGTAASWIHVGWTDGPTNDQVRKITHFYQGAEFNGQTDGYDRLPSRLVSNGTDELPEEVEFYVDGINHHRYYSDELVRSVLVKLARENFWFWEVMNSRRIDIASIDSNSIHRMHRELTTVDVPFNKWFRFDGKLIPSMRSDDLGMVVNGILHHLDVSTDTPKIIERV